jgi:tetratricopeptide (TPR) repeat protein
MADMHTYIQHYKRGLEYFAGGHYEQALISLKKAIVQFPDFPDAYFLISRIYEEMERFADAISIYEKLLNLSPNDIEIRCSYAKTLLKAGEEKKGVHVLKKALRMNKHDPIARMELIHYYFKQKNRLRKALSLADAGIKLLPEYVPFYTVAGDILRKQKKFLKAQDYYETALELDSGYDPAKRGLNATIRAMENPQDAKGDRSSEDESREELIVAAGLYSSGHYDQAIIRLLDLKDRPGIKREASMLLGRAFARKGLYKRAHDVLLLFTKDHAPDLMVLYNLGLAANRMGRYEEAIRYLGEALKRDDEFQEALIEMGVACQMIGENAAAKDYFVRALKNDRNDPRPYAHLARMAYDRGDRAKVKEFLKRAIECNPNTPEIPLVRGYIIVKEERYDEAIPHLQKCLDMSHDHFEAHKLLGHARLQLGDEIGALECFKAAASLNPADQEIEHILGTLAAYDTP